MFRKLIYKMRKRRFCKLNRWFCPDCIYHDFVFEGVTFRGNKCRYPKYRERGEPMKTTDYCDICKRDMCEFCVADNANPYCVPSHYEIKQDEPKGDLISKAEAIEAIENTDWYHQNQNKDMVHGANDDEHQAWYKAQDIYKALEAVPSADRPRGEWKQIEINGYPYAVCDQCHLLADIVEKDGELVMSMANADEKYANFCPNCGADMRGEDE